MPPNCSGFRGHLSNCSRITLKALKGVGAIELATVHRIRLHDPTVLHAIADGADPEANLRIEEAAQSTFEYTRFTAIKCNELRTTEA